MEKMQLVASVCPFVGLLVEHVVLCVGTSAVVGTLFATQVPVNLLPSGNRLIDPFPSVILLPGGTQVPIYSSSGYSDRCQSNIFVCLWWGYWGRLQSDFMQQLI